MSSLIFRIPAMLFLTFQIIVKGAEAFSDMSQASSDWWWGSMLRIQSRSSKKCRGLCRNSLTRWGWLREGFLWMHRFGLRRRGSITQRTFLNFQWRGWRRRHSRHNFLIYNQRSPKVFLPRLYTVTNARHNSSHQNSFPTTTTTHSHFRFLSGNLLIILNL